MRAICRSTNPPATHWPSTPGGGAWATSSRRIVPPASGVGWFGWARQACLEVAAELYYVDVAILDSDGRPVE